MNTDENVELYYDLFLNEFKIAKHIVDNLLPKVLKLTIHSILKVTKDCIVINQMFYCFRLPVLLID